MDPLFTPEQQLVLDEYQPETVAHALKILRHQAKTPRDPFTYCLAICKKIESGPNFNHTTLPTYLYNPQANKRILHIATNRPWFKKNMSVEEARKKLTQEVLDRRTHK